MGVVILGAVWIVVVGAIVVVVVVVGAIKIVVVVGEMVVVVGEIVVVVGAVKVLVVSSGVKVGDVSTVRGASSGVNIGVGRAAGATACGLSALPSSWRVCGVICGSGVGRPKRA